MSTRSHVAFYSDSDAKIEKPEVILYKHSDGYPSNMMPLIMPLLSDYKKHRGGTTYTDEISACLLYHIMRESNDDIDKWDKENPKAVQRNKHFRYCGFGIDTEFHGDIEYLYAVYPKESLIRVYYTNFWEGNLNNRRLLFEIGFDDPIPKICAYCHKPLKDKKLEMHLECEQAELDDEDRRAKEEIERDTREFTENMDKVSEYVKEAAIYKKRSYAAKTWKGGSINVEKHDAAIDKARYYFSRAQLFDREWELGLEGVQIGEKLQNRIDPVSKEVFDHILPLIDDDLIVEE